jgi:hypothetical protein
MLPTLKQIRITQHTLNVKLNQLWHDLQSSAKNDRIAHAQVQAYQDSMQHNWQNSQIP